jgi:signal transduction histidine kinase
VPRPAAQVFEPFFTTHSKGTGLGLYISRELAEANGAVLELCRRAGRLPVPISDSSDASNHDPD